MKTDVKYSINIIHSARKRKTKFWLNGCYRLKQINICWVDYYDHNLTYIKCKCIPIIHFVGDVYVSQLLGVSINCAQTLTLRCVVHFGEFSCLGF